MCLFKTIFCFFSFQTPTPKGEEKQFSETKTQTLESGQNSRIEVDEHVPLIPKPPSYQTAILESSSVEAMNEQQQLEKLKNNKTGIEIRPKTLVEIHSNIHPSGPLTDKTRASSSIPNSFPKLSEPDSIHAQTSLYGDTTSLYGTQKQNTSKYPIEINVQKNISVNAKDQEDFSKTSNQGSTTSGTNSIPNVNQQKVRFNLEPMNLNDIKHENIFKDSKRLRIEDVNLSFRLQDYRIARSPSDPSVCQDQSIIENTKDENLSKTVTPHLTPRERKVRFQTCVKGPNNDYKSASSYRTLPRNHRVLPTMDNRRTTQSILQDTEYQENGGWYSNMGRNHNVEDRARWSLIPTDFSLQSYHEDRDNPRLVALEERTHQLDSFLTEYKNLQLQLIKMRKECDSLRQENLKKDMEALKLSILNQPWQSLDKQYFQNKDSSSERPMNKEIVVKPILKNAEVSILFP